MGVNNSSFNPKNPDQVRNMTAQAQMALMGYEPLPGARTPGFKTDADLVQIDQYERFQKDKTGQKWYNAYTPEDLAKKIQEDFAKSELAQKNLKALALKAGDRSQSLTSVETFELQAGLRAMGHDVQVNGDRKDEYMLRTAELIASSGSQTLAAPGSSKMAEFQKEMLDLGFRGSDGYATDGRITGDMMMSVGDMMNAMSRTDHARYTHIIEQLGHSSVTKNDLEDPDRFKLIKDGLDAMAGKKAENAAMITNADWPASLGESNKPGGLTARQWSAASEIGTPGYDHKNGTGQTFFLSGLPKPDPGMTKISDGLGGLKDGPLRYDLKV